MQEMFRGSFQGGFLGIFNCPVHEINFAHAKHLFICTQYPIANAQSSYDNFRGAQVELHRDTTEELCLLIMSIVDQITVQDSEVSS